MKIININTTPKLITDLGTLPINSIRKDTGAVAKKRFGIYECPMCNQHFKALSTQVKNKRKISCNNCSKERKRANLKTHGDTNSRLYSIYCGIKTRVLNKNRNCSKNYILRGIGICDEWKNKYETFREWSLLNGYNDSLTIDRIDNDLGYEPNNCRWVDRTIQAQNKRPLSCKNTSGYKGATKASRQNKWVSRISVNKKAIIIGTFDNARDAGYAYDKYVIDNNLEHSTNGLI